MQSQMQAHSPLDSAVTPDDDDTNDGKPDDSRPGDKSGNTYVTLLHMYPTVHHVHDHTCT